MKETWCSIASSLLKGIWPPWSHFRFSWNKVKQSTTRFQHLRWYLRRLPTISFLWDRQPRVTFFQMNVHESLPKGRRFWTHKQHKVFPLFTCTFLPLPEDHMIYTEIAVGWFEKRPWQLSVLWQPYLSSKGVGRRGANPITREEKQRRFCWKGNCW